MFDKLRLLKKLYKRVLQILDNVNQEIAAMPDYATFSRSYDEKEFSQPERFEQFARLYDDKQWWIGCRNRFKKEISMFID